MWCAPRSERLVIARALICPEIYQGLAAIVAPRDFYAPEYEAIWRAAAVAFEESGTLDIITLCQALGPQLPHIGGCSTIASVLDEQLGSYTVEYHAWLVRECSVWRQLTKACQAGAAAGEDHEGRELRPLARYVRTVIGEALQDAADALNRRPRGTTGTTVDE